MQQPTKQSERELMQELQRKRETPEHRDPQWAHDFWQRDSNERIRRQLGFGLISLAFK